MQRQQLLSAWLHSQFPGETFTLAPASADASFRRYFRATFPDGRTLIVMDAPPQHEDCRPFLHIAQLFEAAGTHVPHVYAQDLRQGFLLLSDLGSTTYLQALNGDTARELYGAATDALIKIQLASNEKELPPYDEALLRRELNLFPEWYIAKHLGVALGDSQRGALEECFRRILASNLAQPRVYVHRDYHSRNLMATEPNPGILDFQDAVYGPITYDLASLFKDAYIRREEAETLDWLIRYWEKARKAGLPVADDFSGFYRDYEWMGVQRHLKVLGIFARLYHRDGKDGYLKDLPLVMDYLRAACERYIGLRPLLNLLDELEPHNKQVGYTF
ncbi:MAG: aminoglycoside phosphotransferase [Gallionellales bacterium RIFCSPLOWO2_12_FULL_59_22]|nr:MAG: aminoglycoside phosphotransferase [Gallionellales bacterium RIFCSPLOWO2_02_FULL_59_110]OGT02480.1 MAG: aminoglycoside phosphotransferase [Gallionellales bacterium RIFCSPLOWO2_02_58_13]OGT13297.1 MAG: aminoglycoside phosphotransferase [Gallionellales bacterium RIFCSPLOWO2_12_FULL_59_22]